MAGKGNDYRIRLQTLLASAQTRKAERQCFVRGDGGRVGPPSIKPEIGASAGVAGAVPASASRCREAEELPRLRRGRTPPKTTENSRGLPDAPAEPSPKPWADRARVDAD